MVPFSGARMREERIRFSLLDEPAALEEAHAVCDFARKPHLMRDEQHGVGMGAGEIAYDFQHLADHFRIERRCRFIEQQDLRLHGKRPRNGDALLLAAGTLTGIVVLLVGKPTLARRP